MGVTYANVDLTDLTGTGPAFSARFLVDTGALECLAARDELHKIGIVPIGRSEYELADGTAVELEYGFVRVKVLGMETVSHVTFGQAGVEPILGVVAMENLALIVDPRTQTLKRVHSKPLKRCHALTDPVASMEHASAPALRR